MKSTASLQTIHPPSKLNKDSDNRSNITEDNNGKQHASHATELATSKKRQEGLKRSRVKKRNKSEAKYKNLQQSKNFHKYGNKCHIRRISNNVTLHSGMDAGNFKIHGKSNNITNCAELCCQDQLCDIALIMTGRCYTVQCYSMEDCQSKTSENKAPDIVIAYIDKPRKEFSSESMRMRNKEAGRTEHHVHKEISKKTVVPNPNEGNECVT